MARGIASFVDAIFLMLISATAAAILVYSGSHYGVGLQRQSTRLVMEYYARQTIRTLAAASVIRSECGKPDYLLAYIKESLSKSGTLDTTTFQDVNSVVSKALAPLSGYYDYAVSLRVPGGSRIDQIFGVCHSCPHSTRCTPQYFNLVGDKADTVRKTISNSLYVYSSYAPVRIRLDSGYQILLIQFYIWPAGTIKCP